MNRRNLVVGGATGMIVAIAVGLLSADAPGLAMALALVPGFVAVALASPGAIAAATLPTVFLTHRMGPSSFDMSIADFALIVAVVVALAGTTSVGRTTFSLLRVVAVYELLMLSVVAANPTSLAITEWAHRGMLTGGSLIVGAAIVRHHMTAVAIRLLLGTACVFALGAVGTTLRSGFEPAYPLGVHKNAAGSLLAMVIALVATLPDGYGIPARARRPLYFLLGAGLFATRSRGAMVGLGVALLVWLVVARGGRRLRILAFVTAAFGSLFVWNSVQTELRTDVDKTGSIGTRERQEVQAWRAFEINTLRGAGIRYYDSTPVLARDGRPSSTVHETLAESGWVGLAALAVIVAGPFVIFRRRGSPWRAAALSVFAVKAVHGVFDNFWVAGPFTLPWLIIGIAAALSLEPSEAEEPDEAEGAQEAEEPALSPAQ